MTQHVGFVGDHRKLKSFASRQEVCLFAARFAQNIELFANVLVVWVWVHPQFFNINKKLTSLFAYCGHFKSQNLVTNRHLNV
jgi:hypothetical protein